MNKDWEAELTYSRKFLGGATIENLDFEELIDRYNPRKGDFWYLDPPYIVATEKGSYYNHSFDMEDHERLRESVKGAIEAQEQRDSMIEEPKNMYDIPKNDWTQKMVRKLKKARYIPYMLMDFGASDRLQISRLDSFHKFRVLINTGNPKFKFFDERQIPELITMYISEILIKEVLIKKEGKYIKSDVDKKVSEFYDNYLEKVRQRIVRAL